MCLYAWYSDTDVITYNEQLVKKYILFVDKNYYKKQAWFTDCEQTTMDMWCETTS